MYVSVRIMEEIEDGSLGRGHDNKKQRTLDLLHRLLGLSLETLTAQMVKRQPGCSCFLLQTIIHLKVRHSFSDIWFPVLQSGNNSRPILEHRCED